MEKKEEKKVAKKVEMKEEKKVAKKVEGYSKESKEVDEWIHADDPKPVDPIPATPI
jgi:hypothetical protein